MLSLSIGMFQYSLHCLSRKYPCNCFYRHVHWNELYVWVGGWQAESVEVSMEVRGVILSFSYQLVYQEYCREYKMIQGKILLRPWYSNYTKAYSLIDTLIFTSSQIDKVIASNVELTMKVKRMQQFNFIALLLLVLILIIVYF